MASSWWARKIQLNLFWKLLKALQGRGINNHLMVQIVNLKTSLTGLTRPLGNRIGDHIGAWIPWAMGHGPMRSEGLVGAGCGSFSTLS
jgi:hypothetical protein